MTHQLLLNLLDALGARLVRVRITALIADQFHATLDLTTDGPHRGVGIEVSARASDAVILAVRQGCPIEVADTVLDHAGHPATRIIDPHPPPDDPVRAEAVDPSGIEDQVHQLRDALTDATGADFAHPPRPEHGPDATGDPNRNEPPPK